MSRIQCLLRNVAVHSEDEGPQVETQRYDYSDREIEVKIGADTD